MQAKISEIFLSYQGEGPFLGSRQLFVRFYGCNLECVYCDTPLESYKSFSKEALLGKMLDFGDDYNELSLTGGEPLLFADFLSEFLPLYRKHQKHRIYLETNGVLAEEFGKIIDHVDIVCMDFKLPSSTGIKRDLWKAHEKFVMAAGNKELVVKTVVTDTTTMDDIKRMSSILAALDEKFVVVLQPVTACRDDVKSPDEEMLSFFKEYVLKETGKETLILGQSHKYLGIR